MLNNPHYYVQFWEAAGSIRETALRNVGADAMVFNTLRLLHGPREWERALALSIRLIMALSVLLVYYRLNRRAPFGTGTGRDNVVLNSYAVLPVLMLAVSPSIWEHHFVFLMLTMLVLIAALRELWEAVLYCLAYLFIFLFPVFDIYPVSYLRLVGLMSVIVLLYGVAWRHAPETRSWMQRVEGWAGKARNGLRDGG
jgi:hypothetical protein